jgi:P4 family phage/plasmid primase-like protien
LTTTVEIVLGSIVVKDSKTLLLNGDERFKVDVPRNIMKKTHDEQISTFEDLIAQGCIKYDFYASDDAIQSCAKRAYKDQQLRSFAIAASKAEAAERQKPGAWLDNQRKDNKHLDVTDMLINEILKRDHYRTVTDTKEIFWHNKAAFRDGGEDQINVMIEELAGPEVNSTDRREVIERIRIKTLINRREFDKDLYLVNAKNCIIDLRTGKCMPHNPKKHLFLTQLPVNYDPKKFKNPRKVLDFLYNVMHPSDVSLVIEFLGYCLIKDCRFQKALMIAGPPNSGKSKFLGLVMALFGKQNISTKTMHQLNENRFATAALFGKLVNVFADISDRRLKDIEMFKVVVAGDTIDAENKFKNAFSFTPFAKLIFSANLPPLPPSDREDDDAFYKRWLVVSFNLRKKCFFCGERIEMDDDILHKLTTEEELSGLLFLAVKAAQRLISKHRFTRSQDIDAAREQYQKKADPVKAWGAARCIFYEEYETDKEHIYNDYLDYCLRKGLPTISIIQLARELSSIHHVRDERVGPRKDRKHVWKGVALRKDLIASGQLDLTVYGEGEEVEEGE